MKSFGEQPHTGKIACLSLEILDERKIQSQILYFDTDDGSNMVKASKYCNAMKLLEAISLKSHSEKLENLKMNI